MGKRGHTLTYFLKSCVVKGFLGREKLWIHFDSSVNFLIGKNGTGKTTFVRLLYAAVNADREELSRIPFESIILTFVDDETGNSPQLKIEKSQSLRPAFAFYFRHNSRSRYKSFSDRAAAEGFFQFNPHSRVQEFQTEAKRQSTMTNEFRMTFLANIRLSWLPLLRTRAGSSNSYEDSEHDGDEFSNPIDGKISDLVSNITRYFSRLDSRAAAETKNFQRDYFLSLLNYAPDNVFGPSQDDSHYANLEGVMRDIFIELGISEKDFGSQVSTHFSRVRIARKKLDNTGVDIDDYFAVADTRRLIKIVANFRDYEEKKKRIFEPKQRFITLMNEMLINKDFDFSNSNEPIIRNIASNALINTFDLSSGEKQLFVILAETLLQEGRRYIFIADEPELSLHVEWQESIVRNIKSLNDNCQIVFATHSPDVVSSYQENIFEFGNK